MRKILKIILMLQVMSATAQVGVHTDFPDNSSAMDIVASNRGLLIPRVTLTSSLSNPSPVTSPAVGLLVFNSGANQPIGFYFWNGSTWVAISGSSGGGGGNDWTLTGNAGTIPGTNFLGTTDNQHFLIKTNNAERIRFESDGQVILGGTAPSNATDLFTVFGNSTQNAAINAYSPRTGFQTVGGRYGILSTVDTISGFSFYGRNLDTAGYGLIAVGSNMTTVGLINNRSAGIHCQGKDGLHSRAKKTSGYGIFAMDSNATSTFNLAGITAGVSAAGKYGIIARGLLSNGRGIVAIGSGMSTPSTSLESEGGAFTGFHGIFGKGNGYQIVLPDTIAGTGVIGIGYNHASYSVLAHGISSGGVFTGDYGVYAKGLKIDGTGVVGVGTNGIGYYTVTNGSGGAFTGYHGVLGVGTNSISGIGVIGAGNNGVYTMLPSFGAGGSLTGLNIGVAGFGSSATGGIGVIGAGNGFGALYPSGGAGGSFTGNVGLYSKSTASNGTGLIALGNNIATPGTFSSGAGGTFIGTAAGVVGWGVTSASGTGIIGAGNNIATPLTYSSGSGGAFTGTAAGVVGYGTTAATGIGVIGVGNNATYNNIATGSGGAFTGTVCGVYGYATNSSNLRYGGYFAAAGNVNTSGVGYAYVGGRAVAANGTTYQSKIVGAGTVQTIVKNTEGNLIALTCPEAPEMVFQDFGVGQLINGKAHITIDPDLAININVCDEHPLKVYITPEGDCNGVYVTNKSANGFDVVELRNGASNVPFSWQIVATRANEVFIAADGTTDISDYSHRFPPAPGPIEFHESPANTNQMLILETKELKTEKMGETGYANSTDVDSQTLQENLEEVIELNDKPNE